MSSNYYNSVRFFAAIITVMALISEPYLPKKTKTLHPHAYVDQTLYSDRDFGGVSEVRWLDKTAGKWFCNRIESDVYPSCGYSISFQLPRGEGLDFSAYNGFKLHATYEGDAQRVRIFLRNFNPAYTSMEDTNSSKFMSMVLHTKDLDEAVLINFDEFTVIDWWISQYQISREHSAVELNTIEALGIDHLNLGPHTLTVHKIELIGDFIKTVDLYLIIIMLWMAILIYEGSTRLYQLRNKTRQKERLIRELKSNYKHLEEEKNLYEMKSTTDHLTGAQNRTGIQQFVDQLIATTPRRTNIGLMIFDIDHFKRVNDRRGHDTGDRVLKSMAKLISINTRDSDLVGRWGGEEFLHISSDIQKSNLMELAEKLRNAVAFYTFEENDPLTITISIGVTLFRKDEPFLKALKRADDALYAAKNNGRNCCVFQD